MLFIVIRTNQYAKHTCKNNFDMRSLIINFDLFFSLMYESLLSEIWNDQNNLKTALVAHRSFFSFYVTQMTAFVA